MSYLKFQADQLFDGYRFRDKEEVLITDEQGIIQGIFNQEDAGEDIQFIEGILSPGFVNAHCHLELSYLKDRIPCNTGLVPFLSQVMKGRNAATELIEEAIEQGENEMIANGIVALGDICNTTHTIKQKQKGRLIYQNFIEVAGFVPAGANARFDAIKDVATVFEQHFPDNTSIVPHAPYSVSPLLFDLIRNHSNNKVFTIHNQESAQEDLFFKSRKGDFLSLYNNIGVDISFFKPSFLSSIKYYIDKIDRNLNALFVHNTFSKKEDLQTINDQINNPFYCLCPLANLYIEGRLPDIDLFRIATGDNNIVIGTDSLASNKTLSILDEIVAINQHYPSIPIEELLKWSTINGAKALTLDKSLGSFEVNKQPGIVNIGIKKNYVKTLEISFFKVFL